MWQTITAIAVPLIVALGGLLNGGGNRLSKKIAHHADLLSKLSDAPEAHRVMRKLIAKEALWLDEREVRRHRRKVNWPNLSGGIIFAILTAAAIWGLFRWVSYTQRVESPFFWIAVAALGFFGVLMLLITGSLFSRTFLPDKAEEKKLQDAIDAAAERMALDSQLADEPTTPPSASA